AVFLNYYNRKESKYNLLLAATAEEEISGKGGIEALLPHLPPIASAVVGEPTGMQLAVAERGLMVVDALSTGVAGHAARNEGHNALYKALDDVSKIRALRFPKESPLLGPVSMNVTVLRTDNAAHNVVPSTCNFVVDVRVNELYTLEEVLEILQSSLCSELTPRSMRLRPSSIDVQHPLVAAGASLGLQCYGSPTTSDKSLMPFPALKLGPGESSRSHSADEFIYLAEIETGIDLYIQLLNQIL
ncbi:MAG TPA: M20/M25/M40 family metallo-hydrolase, partial [Flavisolibacter sp.]|nr:M20/M25/M40 family metallo-hydrolase [Flavisolibacter sp.]